MFIICLRFCLKQNINANNSSILLKDAPFVKKYLQKQWAINKSDFWH